MRYGIAFIPAMPAHTVVNLAREAEELGYDDLYLPDQTFHRDPFALLALCSQATTRIRLGLALANPYTRHPIEIARAAGTLAEMCGGRFLLGLGAGNRPRVLAGHGIEQRDVVTRIRDAVNVIRSLLAGETVTHRSATLTVDHVSLDFDVTTQVPILIGTRAPRMLALAGAIADGVLFEGLFTPSALTWAFAQVRRPERDHPGKLETIAWQSLALSNEPEYANSPHLRRWAALLISTTQTRVLEAIGISEEAVNAARREPQTGEPTGSGIPAKDVKKLLLVGTPDEIAAQLVAVKDAGVDTLATIVLGETDQVRATMRRFASEVRPQLRV